ncbi:antitoxin [Promineifilum sp.]|uniref:antitoxin n=1 Tax=Promineifilum sp. TaxID=2664178 RepID=UPI0035AF87B1
MDDIVDPNDKELNAQLDEEEREILESYERGEWVPVPDKEAVIARLQSYADATLRKDRRVNIRLTGHDLAALQNIALEEGIPYQTLMSSILHKYVTGRLVERPRSIPQQATYTVQEERGSYDD